MLPTCLNTHVVRSLRHSLPFGSKSKTSRIISFVGASSKCVGSDAGTIFPPGLDVISLSMTKHPCKTGSIVAEGTRRPPPVPCSGDMFVTLCLNESVSVG